MTTRLDYLSYDKRWRKLRLFSLEKRRLWEEHTWPSRRVTIHWLPYHLITFMGILFSDLEEKNSKAASFSNIYYRHRNHVSKVYVSFEGLYPTYVYKAKGSLSSEFHVRTAPFFVINLF